MSSFFIVTLILLFSLLPVYGHGGDKHDRSPLEKKVEVDADGFEIVSTAPSLAKLSVINRNYLKSVKTIFAVKCLSCHGVNNSPPWYYSIPGPRQLMDYDMKEAKKHMDMSNDFPFGGHGNPVDDLNSLSKTIKKGDMPPIQYRIIHWDSKLTDHEIRTVLDWIKNSKNILNTK